MEYNHPMGILGIDLHDLWDDLIEIAKITPADEADLDRIVTQHLHVVRTRETGNFLGQSLFMTPCKMPTSLP
ncbi:hypothetical protein BM221_003292 [Beauveria bassiana]|uniref:Uncharacterized protein n=1 Tax=Beauveria bassiana TaxID=176275 RepID=A0A2N6NU85_BEABA|nr:hypothetical protein BM221_003292 [Beauveria bassiana]